MGENSKISWTDNTFNPWIGCMNVGPGCDNCYAEALDKRWGNDSWGAGKPRRRTSEANWKKPISWNRKAEKSGTRTKVFCASLADVFDNEVPEEWRVDLFNLIRDTPHLDWIILTKRIGNVEKMLPPCWGDGYPNFWLVITVVNQEEYYRDIAKLAAIPAAVHGLSVEPQLGNIGLNGGPWVDWIICGAESCPHRRPFNEEWARNLRDQALLTGAAFFYKQRIENGRKVETPELDGKVWAQFPTTN